MALKKRFYKKESQQQMEKRDAGMIQEDHSACANLPQQSVMKEWPRTTYFDHSKLNDSVSGIDHQVDADVNQASRHRSKSKY